MKKLIKSVPFARVVNAKWKARRTKKKYRLMCEHYGVCAKDRGIVYSEEIARETLRNRLASRGIQPDSFQKGQIKILYVGTDQDQDTGGFLQTLETFGEVTLFEKEDGSYGHYFYGKGKDAEKQREENGRRLVDMATSIKADRGLTLVLGQMWGRTMPWKALKMIQKMGVCTANICMDDRHSFQTCAYKGDHMGALGLIEGLDLALTTTPEACLWYAVEGCPAVFWPEASTPEIFRPMHVAKKYDVSFVGGSYGIRKKIVQAIRNRGVKVECYGSGWPNGRIPTEDAPGLFASSRIILGVGTIGHCEDFYSLKLRDFDATLSGSMYITHDNPDLYNLYEVGKEIVTYRTPEECADRVVYYLEHPGEMKAIADGGLRRALQDHTLERRIEQLFNILGQ